MTNFIANSTLNTSSPRKKKTDVVLVGLFCSEVRMQLALLNPALLRLESEGPEADTLAALMRSAHSLKGAARMVHIDLVVILAHELENYFVAVQFGKIMPQSRHCDVLFQSVDALSAIANRLEHFPMDDLIQETPLIEQCVNAIANLLLVPIAATTIAPSVATSIEESNSIPESLLTLIPSTIPSEIPSTILSEIPSTIPSAIPSTILSAIPSTILSAIPPAIPPAIPLEIPAAIPSKISSATEPIPDARTIRLSRENLSRLMGLAGESMTESTWLDPFARSLLQVKAQQSTLIDLLDQLQAKIPQTLDPKIQALLTDARTTASQSRRAMSDCTTELDDFSRRSTQLADRLYQEVIHSQMRPFSDISSSFPRMVRDLARQVDKPIKLDIIGSNTPIDRDILERLEAPLTHLFNNAIDHGIEPQSDRIHTRKPAHGTLSLHARHRAGTLIISLQDDGGGIDIPQLRQHIIIRNLATPELVARLSEPELLEFLYLPGFSTHPTVTHLSGRGVGLDVVHNLVHSVGGSLKTTTQKGVGTTVSLYLPLTLSVLRTLVVDIAGHPYAFPMTRLDRVLTLSADDIQFAENRPYFVLGDQAIGLVQAHQVLALPESRYSDSLTVLVLGDRNAYYGLIVDRLLGEEKLVVKPIDPRLGKIPNLNATAVRSDGSIVFILDSEDLLQSMQKLHSPEHWQAPRPEKPLIRDQVRSIEGVCKKILAIDDSITVRATERKLLENQGYQVDTAVNGADGWNTLQLNAYDLVITDVDMPRMNGLELVSEMKRSQMLQAIPIIIISYKDREEDRIQGLEVGANYYLTKSSFQDDTLVQAVLDLIGPAMNLPHAS